MNANNTAHWKCCNVHFQVVRARFNEETDLEINYTRIWAIKTPDIVDSIGICSFKANFTSSVRLESVGY